MSYFIVCLELGGESDHHPVVSKLSHLRSLRADRSLWFVEYTQGAETLEDFLRPSLYEGDGLLVRSIDMALLGLYRQAVQAWMEGDQTRKLIEPSDENEPFGLAN